MYEKTREINLGRITGKSAYELAIEAGTFTGTLEDYNNREKKMFEAFDNYEAMVADNDRKYGEITNGSWFGNHAVKSMDKCFSPTRTYISPSFVTDDVISNADGLVMFECTASYLADKTPATIRQDIYFVDDEIPTHMWRMQSSKGNPTTDKWTDWIIQ